MVKRYSDQSDWDKIVSPITLEMKKGTWEIFKDLVPRKTKLKDAVVGLIHKFIYENTEEVTDEEITKWYKDQEYWEKKKSNSKN